MGCQAPKTDNPIEHQPKNGRVCGDVDTGKQAKLELRPRVRIHRAVGAGSEAKNMKEDVKAVQQRLKDLGFSWITVDGAIGPQTIKTIKLFQAIITNSQVNSRDGRIDPGGKTERWLFATNAPGWVLISSNPAGGYAMKVPNTEKHMSTWGFDVLKRSGARFKAKMMANKTLAKGAGTENWAIRVTAGSLAKGGDTPYHSTHEAGMDIDFRPFLSSGSNTPGVTHNSKTYSRTATQAAIEAFLEDPQVKKVLFNDSDIIKDSTGVSRAAGHDNHVHVNVEPLAKPGPILRKEDRPIAAADHPP